MNYKFNSSITLKFLDFNRKLVLHKILKLSKNAKKKLIWVLNDNVI